MDCTPLNLAHFHERRADKLIKRHCYEEALKAVETSLLYVEDAYKCVKISKALEVLNTQKWDYERKLNQIKMRKLQYDKMKSKEIVPYVQTEVASNNLKSDYLNAQTVARSIDKTIKDFNYKYGSTILENNHQLQTQFKENRDPDNSNGQKTILRKHFRDALIEYLETNTRCLSLVDDLQYEDLPSLTPLDLPLFDCTGFGELSSKEKVEN